MLYDIPRREDLFTVDSKEGTVTTNAKLDFEMQSTHNVTLVARDLGNPSLSATALLVVSVVDVPETLEDTLGPMFLHRYYEVLPIPPYRFWPRWMAFTLRSVARIPVR